MSNAAQFSFHVSERGSVPVLSTLNVGLFLFHVSECSTVLISRSTNAGELLGDLLSTGLGHSALL